MTQRTVGTGILVLGLLSCWPTEPCACPPALGLGVVYGFVRSAAGMGMSAVPVEASAHPSDCTVPENQLVDPSRVVTGSNGEYRIEMRLIVPSEHGCVRVAALSSTGATMASAVVGLRFASSHASGGRPDSVRLDLEIP